MADASILKEFLVSLGFKVDTSSEGKFKESIGNATKQMVEFGAAVTAVAADALADITKIAGSLEDLYFASQRTKASGENIKAFGYAVSQLGGSAEGASSSLESLARNMRNSPGYAGMLEGMGVHTKDTNGQLRDTVDIMGDLGKSLASMPYYRANAYANSLGIDEKTLMAMRDGSLTAQMQKYKEVREQIGLGGNEGEQTGHDFMTQMRELGGVLLMLMQKIGITMAAVVLPALEALNDGIEAGIGWFSRLSPQVKTALAIVVGLAAGFIAVMTTMMLFTKAKAIIQGVVGAFRAMAAAAKLATAATEEVAAATEVADAAMAANPIGLIVLAIEALIAALALLWNDYSVWKEGGKSLIDWGAWEPGITAAINGMNALRDAAREAFEWAQKLFLRAFGGPAAETPPKDQHQVPHQEQSQPTPSQESAPLVLPHQMKPVPALPAPVSPVSPVSPDTKTPQGDAPLVLPHQMKSTPALPAAPASQDGDALGLDIVRRNEGKRNNTYGDATGIQTIGYGHTGSDVKSGMHISDGQAEQLLKQDFAKAKDKVLHLVKTALNSKQVAALSDFVFNVGGGAFAKSTLLKKINSGDMAGASKEFAKWSKAGNNVLPGLVHRRQEEAVLFSSGINERSLAGRLPQAPVITQTTTVTVSGVSQPQEAAKAVANAQNDVNNRMARNFKPSVM